MVHLKVNTTKLSWTIAHFNHFNNHRNDIILTSYSESVLGHGSANYIHGPNLASFPFFLKIKFYWNITAPIYLDIICGFFSSARIEFNSCARDLMVGKA